MSYDYDGLVSEITRVRSLAREAEIALQGIDNVEDERAAKEVELLEHLSTSVDKFEVLSKHCPMTPLLWMQYALDTFELMKIIKQQEDPKAFQENNNNNNNSDALLELVETRIQLLELGLHEFPGSAILRLHHAEMVLVSNRIQQQQQQQQQQSPQQSLDSKYQKLLNDAIEALGRGSHRNESRLVVEFYKLWCDHAKSRANENDDASSLSFAETVSLIFKQRAKTPMNEGLNAGLGEQYASVAGNFAQSSTLAEIEDLRRFEAKHFGFLVTYEDDIDVALQTEAGVSIGDGMDRWEAAKTEATTTTDSTVSVILQKWKDILCSSDNHSGCWMGLGGPQTANAFCQYAQACFRYRSRKNDETIDAQKAQALEERIQNMAVSVYERGVAECPTVDSLWLSYLRRLNYLIDQPTSDETNTHPQRRQELLTKASGVVDRAIRNCPYSTDLVKAKLKLVLTMANAGMLVLDPEELMTNTIVKGCLENGFVQPEGEVCSPIMAVELFQRLLAVVRNRILVILAQAAQTKVKTKQGKKSITTPLKFDEPESIQLALSNTPPPSVDIDEEVLQELEDLCSDLREIYDEADSYLRKNHKRYRAESNNTNNSIITVTVEEGRAVLTKERACMESQLVAPLLRVINNANVIDEQARSMGRAQLAEVLQQHDKATKIWQPPHPGTYMAYIEELSASVSVVSTTIAAPTDVLRNLRITRFLYQKALKSVGNPNKVNKKNASATNASNSTSSLSPDELDYETSLWCLCRNYLLFEKQFGSDRSYSECQKAVQKKLSKAFALAAPVTATTLGILANNSAIGEADTTTAPTSLDAKTDASADASNQKRKRADETLEESSPPASKRQKEDPVPPKKPTNHREREEQKGRKFPEHKVKVGKIEHPAHPFTVKVSFLSPHTEDMDLVDALRPKCGPIVHAKIMRDKHTQKSKGWALVQFEERESVETALELSDVLGIKNKSVIIERSHQPAVGLVGMHRVNPQGEGRSTKRNLRNKQRAYEAKGDRHPAKKSKTITTTDNSKKPPPSKPAASTASIFAFRPRGVTGASQQRKPKISFSSSAEAKKGDSKTEK